MRASTEDELLRGICQTIVDVGGYRMAWVGYAEQDAAKTVRPFAIASLDDGYVEGLHLTWADEERGRGLTGTAIRTGTPCFVGRISTDPRFALWREEALRRGYASAIALPLESPQGTFGALHIYGAEQDAFDAKELELLTEMAEDLAYGIQALRTRRAHERAVAEIESLARFPSENPSPVLRVQDDGILLYANPASAPLLQHCGLAVGDRMSEEYRAMLQRAREAGGQPQFDAVCGAQTYSVMISPVPEVGYANVYARDITERKLRANARGPAHHRDPRRRGVTRSSGNPRPRGHCASRFPGWSAFGSFEDTWTPQNEPCLCSSGCAVRRRRVTEEDWAGRRHAGEIWAGGKG